MLKVFGYGWHTGHQHDLLSALSDVQFFYIKNRIKPSWTRENRPWPKNMIEVDKYEPGKYDLAILHLDQQCLFGHPKGIPYMELNKQIKDIPKIVINHATPHYGDIPAETIRRRMKEVVGDNVMVVNSKQAKEEWGFGEVILHGMDPNEWWWDLPKKMRIATTLSPGNQDGDHSKDGWAEYYGRVMYDEIKKRLGDKVDFVHIGRDVIFKNWNDYRQFLGESMIYLHPGIHSPMPRSRTEAMLSGCCVLTTPYHGASDFIRHGENGFLFESAEDAIKIIENLMKTGPGKIQAIGLAGKDTAEEWFSRERYREDWLRLLQKVLTNHGTLKEVNVLKKRLLELYGILHVALGAGKTISDQELELLLEDMLEQHTKRLLEREISSFRQVSIESEDKPQSKQ